MSQNIDIVSNITSLGHENDRLTTDHSLPSYGNYLTPMITPYNVTQVNDIIDQPRLHYKLSISKNSSYHSEMTRCRSSYINNFQEIIDEEDNSNMKDERIK